MATGVGADVGEMGEGVTQVVEKGIVFDSGEVGDGAVELVEAVGMLG